MTNRVFLLFLSLLLAFSTIAVQRAPAETIDEYKERMKEQEENEDREERKKRHRDDEFQDDDDDDGGCFAVGACFQAMFESGCLDAVFSAVFQIAIDAAVGIRYPEYPYHPDSKRPFARRAKPAPAAPAETAPGETPPDQPGWMNKIWMGEFSVFGSYLFGQDAAVFDASGILAFNLSALQLNAFYQFLGDEEGGSLHTFSVNGGFVFPSRYYTFSLYAGLFLQDVSPPYVSFGAAAKAFFPGKIIVSVYSLFAVYYPFYFIVINPTIELAVGRFTIGAGFNYYNYNDFILYGPTVKLALWF